MPEITFFDLCNKHIANSKSKKKKSNLSVLKSFTSCDVESCQTLLKTYTSLLLEKYRNKTVLHLAVENKNSLVLKIVLDFFKDNGLDYYSESPILEFDKKFMNIATYSLLLKKHEQFILTYSYNINHNLTHFEIIQKSFIKNYIQNNNENYYFQEKESNILSLSFWLQIPKLTKFILESNFLEKKLWLDELKDEINFYYNKKELQPIIAQYISLNLFNYLDFKNILCWIEFFISNKNNSEFSKYAHNLNNFFYIQFINNDSQLSNFILKEINNEDIDRWKTITNLIRKNDPISLESISIKKVNSIILSHLLNKNLNFNPYVKRVKI